MILGRLKRLWKLSGEAEFQEIKENAGVVDIAKSIKKSLLTKKQATFIPRIKISPAEKIINEVETV